MTIEVLIEKLQEIQKNLPGAQVKYGDIFGSDISPRIMCLQEKDHPDLSYVCIVDTKTELEMMFEQYDGRLKALGVSEENFYKDMLGDFSLDDIKRYVPERYEHAKAFCEEHGLV